MLNNTELSKRIAQLTEELNELMEDATEAHTALKAIREGAEENYEFEELVLEHTFSDKVRRWRKGSRYLDSLLEEQDRRFQK